jgi:hypothetical protein
VLLWLSASSLTPIAQARAGMFAGWMIAALAPVCLLLLAIRLARHRSSVFVAISAASLGVAGLISGW